MSKIPTEMEICQRIAQLRLEVAGPRGKSVFARKVGITPSTYDRYESGRVPPATVLVRMAEVAGVDLRWLLTGEAHAGPGISPDHPVLRRAARLLDSRPGAAGPLAAFLDILCESLTFPSQKSDVGGGRGTEAPAAPLDAGVSRPVGAADATAGKTPQDDADAKTQAMCEAASGATAGKTPPADADLSPSAQAAWVPILGRSAAGVPQFWSDRDEAVGVTTLGELIARHAGRPPRHVRAARSAEADVGGECDAQIITLRAPDADGLVEFVAVADIKARHGDAFAVRIDGESMSPDIRHGDIVVLSPSVPAVEGRAAVVQLRNQIGVTCKLYRRVGDDVHLIPVNEQTAPQTFPADEVLWALRVLARVRG